MRWRRPGLAGAVALLVLLVAATASARPAPQVTVELESPFVGHWSVSPEVRATDAGRVVRVSTFVEASGAGLLCGNCDGRTGFFALRVGARIRVEAQRAEQCASGPGAPRSQNLVGRPSAPYVDLPHGSYTITSSIPSRAFTPGRWRICGYYAIGPDIPVSVPDDPSSPGAFTVPPTVRGPARSASHLVVRCTVPPPSRQRRCTARVTAPDLSR